MNENLARFIARAGLELDAHPAVAFIFPFETAGDHGVGKREKSGVVAAFIAQALDVELEFPLQHRLQPRTGNVAVAPSVNRIADNHVVGRNAFGDGSRSGAYPEKPAHHLLTGADFGESAVPSGIEVDLQGLVVGVQFLILHGAFVCMNRASLQIALC